MDVGPLYHITDNTRVPFTHQFLLRLKYEVCMNSMLFLSSPLPEVSNSRGFWTWYFFSPAPKSLQRRCLSPKKWASVFSSIAPAEPLEELRLRVPQVEWTVNWRCTNKDTQHLPRVQHDDVTFCLENFKMKTASSAKAKFIYGKKNAQMAAEPSMNGPSCQLDEFCRIILILFTPLDVQAHNVFNGSGTITPSTPLSKEKAGFLFPIYLKSCWTMLNCNPHPETD